MIMDKCSEGRLSVLEEITIVSLPKAKPTSPAHIGTVNFFQLAYLSFTTRKSDKIPARPVIIAQMSGKFIEGQPPPNKRYYKTSYAE